MEPGLRDRGHPPEWLIGNFLAKPQWSPVFATGVTRVSESSMTMRLRPQWSPVFATGVTGEHEGPVGGEPVAAMEPGLRDRGHRSWVIRWRDR